MAIAQPDMARYREQLEAVCEQLASAAEQTRVIGSNLCQWAWATNRGRSVQIYWDAAGVYVAYWVRDANSESDETETHQSLHSSYENAVQAARDWLRG